MLLLIVNQFQCLPSVGHGTLAKVLHGALEHGTKETVERNKFTHLTFGGFLGYGEGDIEQRTFVTLHLLVHIVHIHKGVEHLHNQLELIGHKGIESGKVILVLIGLVGAGQEELSIEHGFLFLKEFA